MNIAGQKKHSEHLFSFDGIDESCIGRNKLYEFLCSKTEEASCLVSFSERPLSNESVKDFMESKAIVSSLIEDANHDDFELSFSYMKNYGYENIVSFLCDVFYFFEKPSFIFLKNMSDLSKCKIFCKDPKNFKSIHSTFECCVVFKSVEDDVVWYEVSS